MTRKAATIDEAPAVVEGEVLAGGREPPAPHEELRAMLARLDTRRPIPAGDWLELLDINRSVWTSATDDKGPLRTMQQGNDAGFVAGDVLAWVERNLLEGVDYTLTFTGRALSRASTEEAVGALRRPSLTHEEVERLLAIPARQVAERFGEGRNHIAADDLSDWLEDCSLPWRLSVASARVLARGQADLERIALEAEERQRQEEAPRPLAEAALAAANERRQLEEARRAAEAKLRRDRLLREYGEILRRHDEPRAGDQDRLAELLYELDFGWEASQQIAADLKELERIPQLVAAEADLDRRRQEATAAAKAIGETALRHRQEDEDVRRRSVAAWRELQEATSAPAELESLRRSRPYLFPEE